MNTQVILVAAGKGSRLKSIIPKALVMVKRRPMISWSLDVFEKCSLIDGVVVVANKDYLKDFKKIALKYPKVKAVVCGGAMRSDSVRMGLAATDEGTGYVLVHDAARPLIDQTSIRRLIEAVKRYKAAILAVPVKPTIKMVNAKDLSIVKTLPRNLLWEAQTPQAFDRKILMKAHSRKVKDEVTDDAMLVENMGVKVKIVLGHARNIKITTAEDLELAQRLL